VRTAARALRRSVRRARFRLWTLRLALRLRRNGSRLTLDCPHGAELQSAPAIELDLRGDLPGSFTLRLGRGAWLGRELSLELWSGGDSVLELGENTWFGRGCTLQLRGGAIRLGSEVQVRDHVLLKSYGELRIGDRTIVSRGADVHATGRVTIGRDCGIGERTTIIDSDHAIDGSDTPVFSQPLHVEPIEIADNVMVSANCTVLRGVKIEANALIGAGAVVRGGSYPAGWLTAGVPARALRALTQP
jgi:acetyltransferase-like isoleucine patch superfamily enzyme